MIAHDHIHNKAIMIRRLDGNEDASLFRVMGQIHQKEIETGFLSGLGVNFLKELYHTLAGSGNAIAMVAFVGDRLIGFICVALDLSRLHRDMLLRNGHKLMFYAFPKLIRPSTVFGAIETLLYASRKVSADMSKVEIINFCIESRFQRFGVGRMLLDAVCAELELRGIPRIKAVTGKNQFKARRFYEKLKSQCVEEIEIHKGAKSVMYIIEVSNCRF